MCHYSLSWAKDEKPDRQEMRRAAQESLKALGMERNQALIVSHRDGQPHVHVIANRVDPESGKAAGLSRSKLKLSKWAEGYEREQGKIRCPARERNNKRREAGERVVDGRGHSGGRFRRERMSPQREPRETIPAQREGPERERVAWQRAEERMHWERIQQWREKDLGKLERRSKREWSELYGRQERQRQQLAKDCHGVLGRFRAWRELGGKLREIGGTIRGRTEVLGRFRAELEDRQRLERISLGKAHSEAVRKIESLAGEVYRGGMEGAEGRAREATRRDPSQCMTVIVAETGAGSSARRRRSGWSRCGSSTESKLTRRRCGPWRRPDKRRPGKRRGPGLWRGQGWSGLGKRRQGAGSAVGRNAAARSGTLAPAARFLSSGAAALVVSLFLCGRISN